MSAGRVRDRRKRGMFRVDDEVIDQHGEHIGAHGIAVYAALCKYANQQEQCFPSISTLCKKLKMGRAKLLDTLKALKKCGLIEISTEAGAGRREHNVYTLLEVGSNENQRQEVGSNENHVGSNENRNIGSNENPNHTHREPYPINQVVGATPDDTTTQCLSILLDVKGFPRDQGENAIKLSEYREEFPSADPVEVCRDYRAFHQEKPQLKPTRLRLRNFFKQANRSGPGRSGPRQSNGRTPEPVQDSSSVKEGYEWLFQRS
jgi:biotin operon repressor